MLSGFSRWLPAAFEANWLNPLLFSWVIDREALAPFLPDGLDIDCWGGNAYISLVGLRFESPRVLGIPAPVPSYDEVNLRFYARRSMGAGDRCPGVVFVRQMVPHRATALAARILYREPFVAAQVSHRFSERESEHAEYPPRVAYEWERRGRKLEFWAEAEPSEQTLAAVGSLEEFLTVRHWGYGGKPGSRTRTYQLTRSEWQLRQVSRWGVDGDLGQTYGEPFATVMRDQPASVLLATGSHAGVGWPSALAG